MEEGTWGQELWYGVDGGFGLQTVLIAIFAVVGALATGYAIFLGVMLAKAEDESKRKQAKKRITNTLAGLFIIVILFTTMTVPGGNGVTFLSNLLIGTKDMNLYQIMPSHVRICDVDATQGRSMPLVLHKNGITVAAGDNFRYSTTDSGLNINANGTFSSTQPGVYTVRVYRNDNYLFSAPIIITPPPPTTPPPPPPPSQSPPIAPPPPPPTPGSPPRTGLWRELVPGVFPPSNGGKVSIPRPPGAPATRPPPRVIHHNANSPATWTRGWIDRRVWLAPSASLDPFHSAAGRLTEADVAMRLAEIIALDLEFYGINWGIRSMASIQADQQRWGTGTQMSIRESNSFRSDVYISIGTNIGGTQACRLGPGVARGMMAYFLPTNVPSKEFSDYSHDLAVQIVHCLDYNYHVPICDNTPRRCNPPFHTCIHARTRNPSTLEGTQVANGGRGSSFCPINNRFIRSWTAEPSMVGGTGHFPYIINSNPRSYPEIGGSVNAPAVMIRYGFRDNADDARWIVNNLQIIGMVINRGIRFQFGYAGAT